jgi:hypothetical protein
MKLKYSLTFFFLLASLLLLSSPAHAQDTPSAAETADRLRFQLIDIQAQQETLQLRLQQLDEALKPENIERALAGIGSTRPEELREQRRRQLSLERESVKTRLEELANLRSRLEADISKADAAAYQDSAQTPALNEMRAGGSASTLGWLALIPVGGILGVAAGFLVFRKLRTSK